LPVERVCFISLGETSALYEGTSEIQQIVIANQFMREKKK